MNSRNLGLCLCTHSASEMAVSVCVCVLGRTLVTWSSVHANACAGYTCVHSVQVAWGCGLHHTCCLRIRDFTLCSYFLGQATRASASLDGRSSLAVMSLTADHLQTIPLPPVTLTPEFSPHTGRNHNHAALVSR